MIFAIDPGNIMSGWCVVGDPNGKTEEERVYKPVAFGKSANEETKRELLSRVNDIDALVIERIASYGMAVGRDVFETCEWIGRYTEAAAREAGVIAEYIYRKDEKLEICGNPRAKDSNIRAALIERFAKHDLKNGKGTKSNPDWFFGFKADCWAAYAVAVSYIEIEKRKNIKDGLTCVKKKN